MTIYRDKRNHDHRVEVHKMDDETVQFFPQGGGFQHKVDRKSFEHIFEVAPEPTWRASTVTADWLYGRNGEPDTYYRCWSTGNRWNGWGMPYFERDVVDEIIKRQATFTEGVAPLRWDGDTVVEGPQDPDYPDEIGIHHKMVLPNGVETWGIGAGSWCWDATVPVLTVDELALAIQKDIVELMNEGEMPKDVQSFEDVQDHCDGNCLGDLCEDEVFDRLVVAFGGRDEHEGMPQGMLDLINTAHDQVSAWLAGR